MARIEHVYWKDKIGGELERQVTDAFSYGFTVGPHGEWEMLIAKEDKVVKKNESVNIKIEDVEVPRKAIILPCAVMRHALGFVSSLAFVGMPVTVEETRILKEVIFTPLFENIPEFGLKIKKIGGINGIKGINKRGCRDCENGCYNCDENPLFIKHI